MTRIGIFGGSFDPIHFGHLILAERCRDAGGLDEVVFLPAFQSPLKSTRPTASDAQRSDMIRLAMGGHARFTLSTYELERDSVSYTVDTLRYFRQKFPSAELLFLMGGDSLFSFPEWKSPDQICELASLMVVNRPSHPAPDLTPLENVLKQSVIQTIQENLVESPLIEISSSEIRRRIAAGESIRYLLPRSVEKYIETHRLYLNPS